MTESRPSDRAIAQAFWEYANDNAWDDATDRIYQRAEVIDATAAPVVVGEDLWSLFLKHRDDISTNVLMVGTDDELTDAVRTAALAGD